MKVSGNMAIIVEVMVMISMVKDYVSINSVFQETVLTQDVSNPISLPTLFVILLRFSHHRSSLISRRNLSLLFALLRSITLLVLCVTFS